MRVYFLSPSNILSEYYFTIATGAFRGGPSCTECLTASGFVAVPGSQVFYAMEDADGIVRVGFASAGAPAGTLSEAILIPGNRWQVSQL